MGGRGRSINASESAAESRAWEGNSAEVWTYTRDTGNGGAVGGRTVDMPVSVSRLLVWFGILVVAGAVAVDHSVKQEVENIFKSVEEFMSGKSKLSTAGGEGRRQDVKEASTEPRADSGPAPFPVGVIMSDSLYPLVVGKNVDTGVPFVMNLDQQHALVVARGGGDNFRMVIPYPVVVGSSLSEGPSKGGYTGFPQKHSKPPLPYRTLVGRVPRRNYLDRYNPPGVREPIFGRSQLTTELSPLVRHYYKHPEGVHYKHEQPVAGDYYPDHPSNPEDEPSRGRDPDTYNNVNPQFTYYVEGPRYPVPLPTSTYTHLAPARAPAGYLNVSPPSPVATSANPESPVTYEGVPKDFRPSPYIGNITDYDDGVASVSPHSEIIHSYDDDSGNDGEFTEQDYMDSLRDR